MNCAHQEVTVMVWNVTPHTDFHRQTVNLCFASGDPQRASHLISSTLATLVCALHLQNSHAFIRLTPSAPDALSRGLVQSLLSSTRSLSMALFQMEQRRPTQDTIQLIDSNLFIIIFSLSFCCSWIYERILGSSYRVRRQKS